MTDRENPIMKHSLFAMVEAGAMLWRNNVGNFLQGKPHWAKKTETVVIYPGDVVLRKARHIQCGLAQGSADLIGFAEVDIGGKTVPVFVSAEAKVEKGKASKEQIAWMEMVRSHGGIAFQFRTPAEAVEELKKGIAAVASRNTAA